MQYRKEIDGLRAVAVVPVLFFHAGILGFSGGFVGVDVFFVISGYLITSIILKEIESGSFSIFDFYERRARRILPALGVVLLATTALAYLLMPSHLLKDYSQSLVSVSTFMSNVFFFLKAGYFSPASEEKPLLHTWSLSVEEQFYLFYPILLAVLWRIDKRKAIFVLYLVISASLIWAQYLSTNDSVYKRDAGFYLIFSRSWELFFGGVLAVAGVKHISISKVKKEVMGWVGIVLILFSVFFYNKQTPFPGFYALAPVIGAALIISFVDASTVVGRVLGGKPLVGIGLISYSLYLWHQPIFALMRVKTLGEPGKLYFILGILLSFLLAAFSYRYVERPFRNKKLFSRGFIFYFSVVLLGFFLIFGLLGHSSSGFVNRFKYPVDIKTVKYSPKREPCHTDGVNYTRPSDACIYFREPATWAVFGDSHVVEPAYALAGMLKEKDIGLLHLSFSGCPPIALKYKVKKSGCTSWINESLEYLEQSTSIKNVLLGFRYSAFLYGDQLASYPDIPDEDPKKGIYPPYPKQNLREAYWVSFVEIVSRLIKSGKKVYILYPIPELPSHVLKILTPFSIFGGKSLVDPLKTTSSNYYFLRNEFILDKLNRLKYDGNLRAIKPYNILCNEKYCPAVNNEVSLYYDDDHLSVDGARALLSGSVIVEDLKNESKNSGSKNY